MSVPQVPQWAMTYYTFFTLFYTLLQKKCTLISSSSPSDPGSLTPTPGHVKFGLEVMCKRQVCSKFKQPRVTGSFATYSEDHLTELK